MLHMKIGLLTSGGDCPGMNAAVRAVVVKAIDYGFKVTGINRGWKGLLNEQLQELTINSVSNILHMGGTILGASRTSPFEKPDGAKKILATIEKNKINAIIAIGGRDSLDTALKVAKLGVPVIGIPKTINNTIAHTDYTIGFDTARAIVCDAIDRLSTTASSHHRVMLVESMGRDSGWIALMGGLAGGANYILIPEVKPDIKALEEKLYKRRTVGKKSSIIVVAEGVVLPNMEEGILKSKDEFGRDRYDIRNAGKHLGRYIEENTDFKTRVTVLGHLQRGGSPTANDRIKATRLGIAAVDAIKDRIFNVVTVYQGNRLCLVDLEDVILNSPKLVDLEIYEKSKLFFEI